MMTTPYRRSTKCLAGLGVLVAVLLATGCASAPDRRNDIYPAALPRIRKVLVLSPEINVIGEADKGAQVWLESESRQADARVLDAVGRALKDKGFDVATADDALMRRPDVQEVRHLFRAVNRSIQLHTYGPQIFPSKLKTFDYAMGPVDGILKGFDAQALILVTGRQTLSSYDPKTWISIALVVPDGRIVWYAMEGARENLGIQEAGAARALVNQTLAYLTRSPS